VSLTAKYPATCGVCSASIKPGDEISKVGPKWAHIGCAADQEGTAAATTLPGTAGTLPGTAAKRAARRAVPDPMPAAAGALEVWTDGACSGNPGPGGWAWATKDGRQNSGGSPATTNQRMEIQAALEAVKALGGPLVVVSDSTYVVNCFRDSWWKGWLARGWVNSAKKPVANRDLWEPLITLFTDRGDVSFQWVKGHSGDPMNDLVDRLAVEAGRAVVGSV
jgi:ribonuclease HI